jgi:Spy/CpxP family protein refolding chaperone
MNSVLKWKLIAGFLLVFMAGAMTGAFLLAHFHRAMHWNHRHDILAHRMAEHLRDELNLTPEQFAKLQPVFEKTAAKLEAIRKETGQRVGQAMNEAHDQIAPELTPEQRKKLQAIEERHRRYRHRHRFHHGPHDEPPPPPP